MSTALNDSGVTNVSGKVVITDKFSSDTIVGSGGVSGSWHLFWNR